MPPHSLFDKLSHDQWMQIFNCLRTPLDARHVANMARTCKDFRQLFQKLVTELRVVYDPFVQHQVDDYSDNADHAAFPPDLPAFDAAENFYYCARKPMQEHHLEALAGVLGAGAMRGLKRIVLDDNRVGGWTTQNPAFVALATAAKQPLFPPRLTKLYLVNTGLQRVGLVALLDAASTPGVLASLRKLDLRCNHINTDIEGFATAGSFPALKMLNLENNHITDASLVAFSTAVATPGTLAALKRLGLSNNRYLDRGVAALTQTIDAGAMPALKHLTSIVQRSDMFFGLLDRSTVEALKEAMLARRMFPRQRIYIGDLFGTKHISPDIQREYAVNSTVRYNGEDSDSGESDELWSDTEGGGDPDSYDHAWHDENDEE